MRDAKGYGVHEEWSPVVGYEGRYEVSTLGNVASLNYKRSGRRKNLCHGLDSCGYLQVCIIGKTKLVHNLVCAAFIGEKPNGMQVNHKDCDKSNSKLGNLEYVTPAQNMRHSVRMGTHVAPKGEKSGMSKLTAAAVALIRACSDRAVKSKVLAEYFGVNISTIGRVVTGATWRHSLKGRVKTSGA